MAIALNWTCPHCGKPQIVTDNNHYENIESIWVGGVAIGCLNKECKKLTLECSLYERKDKPQGGGHQRGKVIKEWRLIPESTAKAQPDFIPEGIRQDYYEACRIAELSPKASATLARRCLQGMIRDFCGIQKSRLIDEIKELRERVNGGTAPRGVSPESVVAIDHMREIGNIGAHMEKDVNVIIDIDPDEAVTLLELIETLFEEWYVARNEREKRFARVASINADKQTAKKQSAVPAEQ
jgi:hypothetical protein